MLVLEVAAGREFLGEAQKATLHAMEWGCAARGVAIVQLLAIQLARHARSRCCQKSRCLRIRQQNFMSHLRFARAALDVIITCNNSLEARHSRDLERPVLHAEL